MMQYDDRGRLRLTRPDHRNSGGQGFSTSWAEVPTDLILSPEDPTAKFNTSDLIEVAQLHPRIEIRRNAFKSIASNGEYNIAVLSAFINGLRDPATEIRNYCLAQLADKPLLVGQGTEKQELELIRYLTPHISQLTPHTYLAVSILESLVSNKAGEILLQLLNRNGVDPDLREHTWQALRAQSRERALQFLIPSLNCRVDDYPYREALLIAEELGTRAPQQLAAALNSNNYGIFLNSLRIISIVAQRNSSALRKEIHARLPEIAQNLLRFLADNQLGKGQHKILLRIYARFGTPGLETVLSKGRWFPGVRLLILAVNPTSYTSLSCYNKDLEADSSRRNKTIAMMVGLAGKVDAAFACLLHAAQVRDKYMPEIISGLAKCGRLSRHHLNVEKQSHAINFKNLLAICKSPRRPLGYTSWSDFLAARRSLKEF